jgi:adenylosuccinate synthase
MMKADVLNELESLDVCTGYKYEGKKTTVSELSFHPVVETKYHTLKGWQSNVRNIKNYADLPPTLQEYIEYIEEYCQTKISLISLGPERDETVIR